jgi:hypothetical protein
MKLITDNKISRELRRGLGQVIIIPFLLIGMPYRASRICESSQNGGGEFSHFTDYPVPVAVLLQNPCNKQSFIVCSFLYNYTFFNKVASDT